MATAFEDFFVSTSEFTNSIIEKSQSVAKSDINVLISGPTGVGKEHIAELIYEKSKHHKTTLIRVNCATMLPEMMEKEFFGADISQYGMPKSPCIIDLVDNGTLLLDDVELLPLTVQSRLQMILRTKKFRKNGSPWSFPVNIRLICITGTNLEEKVRKGEFREDLYYLMNGMNIEIPSLKYRLNDIPLLIAHYLEKYNQKYDFHKNFSQEAVKALCNYEYSGNVVELRNIVVRAMIQSLNDVISLSDIHKALNGFSENPIDEEQLSVVDINSNMSLRALMELHEKTLLSEYMKVCKNGAELAKKLQTDQSTISRKMVKYNLNPNK